MKFNFTANVQDQTEELDSQTGKVIYQRVYFYELIYYVKN